MGQILKFPAEASKFGYKRARKCARAAENPDQLNLFSQPTARILSFAPATSPFEEALVSDERGDLKAAELYTRAIENQDCVADAYCNLGIIESKKGNTARAFDCFTTSLKHDPRHSEAHYNLGNLYFEVNDFRLAQIHYEMAGEVDPSFANVYFNLALVQSINHDLPAAINTLTKYQELVSPEEARNAEELLRNLKRSLAARNPRLSST
ncbi:MAG TPA: tetratricopeptide repeat protein [Methylomirabilota bacterium]|nr:tetratricopeptide repeat protein [Methylomirabilota bacterium]